MGVSGCCAVEPASSIDRKSGARPLQALRAPEGGHAVRATGPAPLWNFGNIAIRPNVAAGAMNAVVARDAKSITDHAMPAACEVPLANVRNEDAIDLPRTGGEPAPASPAQGQPGPGAPVAAPADDSCGQALSMGKTVAGGFIGSVTMDDYYPDLAGRGFWQHSGSGGTFDTGKRAGGMAQLFGVIPSPCRPDQFTLTQNVTRTRDRINGVTDPTEGQTLDDIAKSGRKATRAPFRQEFVGGGDAPLGYVISMADPPSIGYGPSTNAEWDRDFVTSLTGPAGRQSVSWSLSVRIKDGVVISNTLS